MLIKNDIDRLPLPELMDLLASKTIELLALMNNKQHDRIMTLQKKKEVQAIQSAITRRKSPNSIFYIAGLA